MTFCFGFCFPKAAEVINPKMTDWRSSELIRYQMQSFMQNNCAVLITKPRSPKNVNGSSGSAIRGNTMFDNKPSNCVLTGNWQTLQEFFFSYSYPLDQQMPTFTSLKNRNYLWVNEDGESSVSIFSMRGEKQLSNLLIKKSEIYTNHIKCIPTGFYSFAVSFQHSYYLHWHFVLLKSSFKFSTIVISIKAECLVKEDCQLF